MAVGGRIPCSDQSLARDDVMYGTASAGHAWALLELSGGWGPSAFLNSPSIIDPVLGRAIARRFETAGMRIAAIRRPGRRAATPRWRWFLAFCDEGSEALYRGEVSQPADYLELALDGSDGERSAEPVVAVCAHGRHDQCCAVRGRQAVAAIADRYPGNTWECSHLGGDRFAATMLILPEGLCYGRIDSTDAAALVTRYVDGLVDNEFLRGRTSLPHAVQAAQYFVRKASGDERIRALSPVTVDHVDDTVRVVLAGASGPVEVVLAEELSEPLLSMCRAGVAGRVRSFALKSISAL
ncbi:sucrase ferredoxin [Mycolicibacterium chubuense]|uniref:Sucrase/ferredoxin-like protein n=1 Tax=Mycolicibacterium chubuense TaxID=1800 RepID=A0A0J6ZFL1_MYCCU|nr:sucrase ferredoxin [Mycolicibacterium chubuense]KMO83576.1 Sucrase/ferredoxin-like protein [Mycolicibacterium chubuense]ORA53987.1 sucrase ferredoxin [Mycolicibacterium chubuense]SPX95504.1 sucraseferredoxin family protein [Mycolicibacterium chubuense]